MGVVPVAADAAVIAATLLEALSGRATRLDRFAIIGCLVELLTERPAIARELS